MLPACKYRVETTMRNNYFCRSPLVHSRGNFVTDVICRSCSLYSAIRTPLPEPSEVPVPYWVDSAESVFGVAPPPPDGSWRWAYGVTVAPRAFPTLQPTLRSLRLAGFATPHLFADGDVEVPSGFDVTRRQPQVGPWPNWILAANELYQRDPLATAFAIFQDDILLSRNVRHYLENVEWPKDGYLNLYTAHHNGRGKAWYCAPDSGRGALALVFSRATLRTLLSTTDVLNHRMSQRGFKRIDVAVSTALANSGTREFVHDPSLVNHRDQPENSTLGHNYASQAPSFRGETFDCLELTSLPRRRTLKKVTPRIGIIGFNTASGIGSCTRDLAVHLPNARWFVVEHRSFPTLSPPPGASTTACPPSTSLAAFEEFCQGIDVLLAVETEFVPNQFEIARQFGVVTACVPMMEWLPSTGWPEQVDTFLCPTSAALDALELERPGRCREFLWPVDGDRFAFRERTCCETFLYIHGHGGHSERKGGDIVREAARLVPQARIVVYDQTQTTWPANCEVRGESASPEAMYDDGDVLLLPARFNGIGLEQLEAMACGLPVIATDAPPMNERPCLDRISCGMNRRQGRRPRAIGVYEPDSVHLAELLRQWQGKNIRLASTAGRHAAAQWSWKGASRRLIEAIQ